MNSFLSQKMTYETGISEYTIEEAAHGFAICQNGMAIETPGGAPMIIPNYFLGEQIVEEILAKGTKRDTGRAPLMQLTVTAIDAVHPARDEVIEQIMAFAESDLLCHRAEGPKALVKEQQRVWQPILDWCGKRIKSHLKVGVGVMPVEQAPETIEALRRTVMSMNDFMLTGLMQAVTASGSLVLGLALAFQQLNAIQVYTAAELDITFQEQKWGDDPEASIGHDAVRNELTMCGRWFGILANTKRKPTGGHYETLGY